MKRNMRCIDSRGIDDIPSPQTLNQPSLSFEKKKPGVEIAQKASWAMEDMLAILWPLSGT